jgi:hypothetical protein
MNYQSLNNLPPGQTVFRKIPANYPLSSQMLDDMFEEIAADLRAIIDNKPQNITEFISRMEPALNGIEMILRLKEMQIADPQKFGNAQISNNTTTDWRHL